MLYTIPGETSSITDNFGATYTDAGLGTTATSGGSTHQKGTPVTLIAGSSVISDIYGIAILFCGGNASNAIRRYFADILVDPNGGSNWNVKIPNLFVNNASLIQGGYRYFFPLYLKSGTSIGFQHQCNLAATALRCSIQLYGKPKNPELWPIGTIVESFGVNLGTTVGTAVVAGTSVLGSYTQIGTTTRKLWWWQWGGFGFDESSFLANSILGDVAAGVAGNQKICCDNCIQSYTAGEQCGKDSIGFRIPYRIIPESSPVWVRAACTGTPEGTATATTTAYGMA